MYHKNIAHICVDRVGMSSEGPWQLLNSNKDVMIVVLLSLRLNGRAHIAFRTPSRPVFDSSSNIYSFMLFYSANEPPLNRHSSVKMHTPHRHNRQIKLANLMAHIFYISNRIYADHFRTRETFTLQSLRMKTKCLAKQFEHCMYKILCDYAYKYFPSVIYPSSLFRLLLTVCWGWRELLKRLQQISITIYAPNNDHALSVCSLYNTKSRSALKYFANFQE